MVPAFDFVPTVRARFAFLEQRGLRVTVEEPLRLRYQGGQAYVEVSHVPYEWSIEVQIGRASFPADRHTLEEFVAVLPVQEPPRSFEKDDRLTGAVAYKAALLEALPSGVLAGDAALFEQAGRAAAKASVEERARWSRARAAEAWLREDYRTVVTELRCIEVPLSPAEAKKLQIALDRVGRLPREP